MKYLITLFIGGLLASGPLLFASPSKIELKEEKEKERVGVYVNGKLITAYFFPKNMEKPVLYPINTLSGKTITRGFPLEQRAGERVDHPHHVGSWLNFGDVNGLDFWNNSYNIPAEKKAHYGTIRHTGIVKAVNLNDKVAVLSVTADWLAPDQTCLLKEETTFMFTIEKSMLVIDRKTILTAQQKEVTFTDNKEGMFAIRLTRALEHPSEKAEIFTDASGKSTGVPVLDNTGVSGKYLSSEGIEGEKVWGTRGRWMRLTGKLEGADVSLVILDHKKNMYYPTYWHSRGYGLFAANPLGKQVFDSKQEKLVTSLKPNAKMEFTFRILLAEKILSPKAIEKYAKY